MEPQFSKMEPGLHFKVRGSRFTVRSSQLDVGLEKVGGTHTAPGRSVCLAGRPTVNSEPPTANANRELPTVSPPASGDGAGENP
jgi:hypothetical protein